MRWLEMASDGIDSFSAHISMSIDAPWKGRGPS